MTEPIRTDLHSEICRSFGSTDGLFHAIRSAAALYPSHGLYLVCYSDASVHLVRTVGGQPPQGVILLRCPNGGARELSLFLRGVDKSLLSRRYAAVSDFLPPYPLP